MSEHSGPGAPAPAPYGPFASGYDLYVAGLDRVLDGWHEAAQLLARAGELASQATIGADLGFPETFGTVEQYDETRTSVSTALADLSRRFHAETGFLAELDLTYHQLDADAAGGYDTLRGAAGRGPR